MTWTGFAPLGAGKPASLPATTAFKQAFELSRPRGPLLGLAAIPVVIQTAVPVLTLLIGLPRLRLDFYSTDYLSLFFLLPAIIVGGGVLAEVASNQLGAAAAVRAAAAAEGQTMSLKTAFIKTRGVAIRVLPVWLLVGVAQWLGFAAFGGGLSTLVHSDPSREAMQKIMLGMLAELLVYLVAEVAAFFLRVKLFLFMPVVAFEHAEGFTALRRSWALTKGGFGTILLFITATTAIAGASGIFTVPAWLVVGTDVLPSQLDEVPLVWYVLLWVGIGIGAALSLILTPLLWMSATGIYRIQTGKAPIRHSPPPPVRYTRPVPPSWAPHPGTPVPPSARQPGTW